jgi:eukaryotic-like serine/threonine-protein kinase
VRRSFQQIIGRYALFDEIASGGMATVHIGRLLGAVGFSRTVAIKRLHPQFAKDPEFVDMFVDEARVAARIRHPNVVPTLDVVKTEDELFLVMDYVQGESLSRLMRNARRQGRPFEIRVVVPILAGVLHGLHAAHKAKGERGEALHIVHRDVSPQNMLVGVDGVSRVFDFGIAKARGRLQTTREGQIKGKLAYMAPEQLSGEDVGPQTDVYAAGVVLWEALAGRRLFDADHEAALLKQVLDGVQEPPSVHNPEVPEGLDAICMMALESDLGDRFQSARAMAVALEKHGVSASATEVGEWVEGQASNTLQKRADRIAEIESQSEVNSLAGPMIAEVRHSHPDLVAASTSDEVETRTVADPRSQQSSISVAGLPRSHSGRGWPIAVIAFLLVGATIAVILLRKPAEGAVGPLGAATSPDGSPAGASASSIASSSVTSSPLASASTSPSSSASASASAASSGAPTSSTAVMPPPRPRPQRPPPPAPKADPCANPFFVDANGIKRIKPACR